MKTYVEPEIEILELEALDIICASNEDLDLLGWA